ncbi:MAG: type IV pilin protein [Gemmatimonadaceae bacterium]|jgi:type IV pilus assembly protein PilA
MAARRMQRGFTLIELLIVVVIIGILATIAIPRFGSTRTTAKIAVMKADLRNLATAQEVQFTQAGAYTDSLGTLAATFQPSDSVFINITVDGTAYTATATMPGVSEQCTLTMGTSGTPSPVCAEPPGE